MSILCCGYYFYLGRPFDIVRLFPYNVCAEVNPSFPASVGEQGAHQAGAEEPTIKDERSGPLRQNSIVLH